MHQYPISFSVLAFERLNEMCRPYDSTHQMIESAAIPIPSAKQKITCPRFPFFRMVTLNSHPNYQGNTGQCSVWYQEASLRNGRSPRQINISAHVSQPCHPLHHPANNLACSNARSRPISDLGCLLAVSRQTFFLLTSHMAPHAYLQNHESLL